MIRVTATLAMVTLGVLGAEAMAAARPQMDRTEAVFREARGYTVRIRTQIDDPFMEDEAGSATGAGFLVDRERGWVVTNAHVVGQSPSDVTVAFAGGPFRPVRKVYVDSFTDVAVLEVAAEDRDHPVASLDCSREPNVGESIGAFGHPLGLPFTGTRGIVSGKTDQGLNDMLQIDATVDHGNSGGPVMAIRDGRVVGIATAMSVGSRADRMNFATPIQDVCKILALLARGIPPDPPQMEVSLLVDEDGRHRMVVGQSFNPSRWPLEFGDRILSVGGDSSVKSLTTLITALRGARGAVPVGVERDGMIIEVFVRPEPRPSIVDRQGVVIDGALIAPAPMEDHGALSDPVYLAVHSVEPGSPAQTLGFEALDLVQSIDGRRLTDVASLIEHMNRRPAGTSVPITFRRAADSPRRWFEDHARELPGEEVRVVGPDPRLLTGCR